MIDELFHCRSRWPPICRWASRNTCTIVPVVNTCTTVPVLVSTSAVASRTSTPVIRLISRLQCVGRVGEQLAMKILHLGGSRRCLGQGFLGRRQGPVQRDDQCLTAQDDGHRLGPVAGTQLLECAGSYGDLLRHGRIGFVHRFVPGECDHPSPTQTKKAGVVEHPEVFDHAGLLVNEPPGKAGLPFI